jgi:hypothetical protein
VHHDKDRRRTRNRQRGNDLPKGNKSPGGSRDDHNPDHRAALTPLDRGAILHITFHSSLTPLLSVVRGRRDHHPRSAWLAQTWPLSPTGRVIAIYDSPALERLRCRLAELSIQIRAGALIGVVSFGAVASAYHHRHQPKVAMILQLSRRSDIQRRPSRIPIMRQAAPVNAKAMNGCSRTKAAL